MPQAPLAPAALLSSADAERLGRAFSLGLNRDPLPLPPGLADAVRGAALDAEASLIALALAAQARRFERPCCCRSGQPRAAAAPFALDAARLMRDDQRPLLPEPARRTLARLIIGPKTAIAQHLMWAALTRLQRRGLRLHPFDLPLFEPLLRANEDLLGPAERAFLALTSARDRSETEPAGLLHETIDGSNWLAFPKAQRLAFLRELRLSDPAAGRALVEACYKEEPPAMRAELIAALEAGLTSGDQAFLESLAGDRAERVRQAASRLLGRLPGTEAHARRMERARGCLQITASGRIAFRPPAAPKSFADKSFSETMTRELFEGLSVSALAGLAQMRPAEFLAGLTDSAGPMLLPVLIPTALVEGDVESIAALASRVSPRDLMNVVSLTRDIHGTFRPEACSAFAAGFVSRLEDAAIIHSLSLADLGAMIGGPLSVELADVYLASAGWKRAVALLSAEETAWRENCDPDTALYTALITPSERLPQFLASIETVRPAAGALARDFARFVLALPGGDGASNPPMR